MTKSKYNKLLLNVQDFLKNFNKLIERTMDECDFGKTRNRKINYSKFIKIVVQELPKKNVGLKNIVYAIEKDYGVSVSRNDVSDKFSQIPSDFFEKLVGKLISICSMNTAKNKKVEHLLQCVNDIKACDSSIFKQDKRLSSIFRHYATKNCSQKSALKLFTQFSLKDLIPTYVEVEEGKTSEKKFLSSMNKRSTLYLIDLGYYKHEQFARWVKDDIYFLSRVYPKAKLKIVDIKVGSEKWIGKNTNELTGNNLTRHSYVHVKAKAIKKDHGKGRVKYYEEEFDVYGFRFGKAIYWYIGNIPKDFDISIVAQLYYLRWCVELFFKMLKSCLQADKLIFRHPKSVINWLYLQILYYVLGICLLHPYLECTKLSFDKIKMQCYVDLLSKELENILKLLVNKRKVIFELSDFYKGVGRFCIKLSERQIRRLNEGLNP